MISVIGLSILGVTVHNQQGQPSTNLLPQRGIDLFDDYNPGRGFIKDSLIIWADGDTSVIEPINSKLNMGPTNLHGLEQAEMQFRGFFHAREGYSLEELISSMGLTKEEWEKMKQGIGCTLSFLRAEQYKEIDDYFSSK